MPCIHIGNQCVPSMGIGHLPGIDQMSWDKSCVALQFFNWANNGHYYARPREDFNEVDAAIETIHQNRQFVILEDLS